MALVQIKATDSNSIMAGGNVAFASNVVAGNTLMLCLARWYTTFNPTLVTDTQGNTWTKVDQENNYSGTGFSILLYTAVAVSSGPCTVTVTAVGGGNAAGGFLAEVNSLQSSPFDQASTTFVNSTSPVVTNNATPTVNGEYLMAFFSRREVTSSFTSNGLFTIRANSPTNGNCGVSDYTQPTAGAIQGTAGSGGVSAGYPVYGKLYTFKTASTTGIKTVNGLTKTSVKVVNGLAIASVKTWNGLA